MVKAVTEAAVLEKAVISEEYQDVEPAPAIEVADDPASVVCPAEALKGGGMVTELVPMTTTPPEAKLTVSDPTTAGGPPGFNVTVPMTKPVGLAVIVLDPMMITSGLVSVFVVVPTTTTPDEPSETGVLATVTAGAPGKTVVEPTTNPLGSAVIVYVPIVRTSTVDPGTSGPGA